MVTKQFGNHLILLNFFFNFTAQYSHYMKEKQEAEEEARAREQKNIINRQLDDVFKHEGQVTPSQQRERGRTVSAGSDDPVYYDPEEVTFNLFLHSDFFVMFFKRYNTIVMKYYTSCNVKELHTNFVCMLTFDKKSDLNLRCK